MATAALLKAAKMIIASAGKKVKKNPAPRKGTAKPKRVSQITKKAPSKRLVKRRKANDVEGFFPNPSEIGEAYQHADTFMIQVMVGKEWRTIASTKALANAKDVAQAYATQTGKQVRVVK